MKDLIKQHPWRLEIVPFAIVILAFIIPAVYRQDMLANLKPWHGYNIEQVWLLRYVLRGIMVVIFSLGVPQSAELWIKIEREKLFNWWAPFGAAVVGLSAWFMSSWQFAPFWAGVILAAIVMKSLIERTRKFNPQQTSKERMPEISIKPGEPFYYREDRSYFRQAIMNMAFFVVLLPGIWTIFGDWLSLLGPVCGAATGLFASRAVVTVSSERISARAGLFRKIVIPIASVSECLVFDYYPIKGRHRGWFTTYGGMTLYFAKHGPNARIETSDGKAYLLGVKDPEGFCKLIEMARREPRPPFPD